MKKNILFLLLFSFSFIGLKADPINWTFKLEDKGNNEIDLIATASIDAGWHMYDSEVPSGGPNATELSIDELKGATKLGKLTFSEANHTKGFDKIFQMELGTFEKQAIFRQRFKVTDKNIFSLKGDFRAQACTDQECTPPLPTDFSLSAKNLPETFKAEAANEIVKPNTNKVDKPTEAQSVENSNAITESSKPQNTIENVKNDLWTPVVKELRALGAEGDTSNQSFLWIFISGFFFGFVALLMPCIWPMIPMTVSFFLKRNKSNKSKAIREAMTYGLGIIIIYVSLGLIITAIFGSSALNDMATNAIFNLLFFGLLLVFGLSFLGAFEITLPSSWTNKMDNKAESTTGIISIFFMAFTLALVSFSCTGPLIGTLLVDAANTGAIIAPALGMLGFALALAIPFTLFAIFPSLLQSMPKSGGWLNSVKVVLGFLEMALALKFLSVADLAYGWGILDREVFLVLWITIFVLLGIYLLGKLKLPHDSNLPHVSVLRLFLAIISLSFALYMVPGLWGAPLKAISAFSPPMKTQDFNMYEGEVHAKFEDFEAGMEYAKRVNKPVMIDFSGYGCVNCRKMEASVWTDPRVKQMLDNDFVLITLMVDDKAKLPQIMEVTEENGKVSKLKTIGDKWSFLQRHKFGTNSQPYYVLLDHNAKPITRSYAYNENVSEYIKFLESGLHNFKNK